MTLKDAIVYLLDEFSLGDQVYTVRERALSKDGVFAGNSWDHPDVTKFQQALDALNAARAEAEPIL